MTADLLRSLAQGAAAASSVLPQPAGLVARIIAEGLGLAADLAAAGQDPVVEIIRIRSTLDLKRASEARADDRLRARFPDATPDTLPGGAQPNAEGSDEVYDDECSCGHGRLAHVQEGRCTGVLEVADGPFVGCPCVGFKMA